MIMLTTSVCVWIHWVLKTSTWTDAINFWFVFTGRKRFRHCTQTKLTKNLGQCGMNWRASYQQTNKGTCLVWSTSWRGTNVQEVKNLSNRNKMSPAWLPRGVVAGGGGVSQHYGKLATVWGSTHYAEGQMSCSRVCACRCEQFRQSVEHLLQ